MQVMVVDTIFHSNIANISNNQAESLGNFNGGWFLLAAWVFLLCSSSSVHIYVISPSRGSLGSALFVDLDSGIGNPSVVNVQVCIILQFAFLCGEFLPSPQRRAL